MYRLSLDTQGTDLQLHRQLTHWSKAIDRLGNWEELASEAAWQSLEYYLGTSIRYELSQSLQILNTSCRRLQMEYPQLSPDQAKRSLNKLRKRYLQMETTLDFFGDAINSRTSPQLAALLRACDHMALQSMAVILKPMGHEVPPVLTYVDKGLGASILKAGLRLWDQKTINPVAAIKVVRHNLLRPTSLIHESGHQLAHMLGWNEDLRALLYRQLADYSEEYATIWSSWASEMAADTFAFVHTGYAAVCSLHDVLSGTDDFVFRFMPGDPHPISYLRVRWNIAMCRLAYGPGPWDELEQSWMRHYPIAEAGPELSDFFSWSERFMTLIASICLEEPLNCFRRRTIQDWISPQRVSPLALQQLKYAAGNSWGNATHGQRQEALRLLAWYGYQIGTQAELAPKYIDEQRELLIKIGQNQSN
ncbi:MAG: hypothetical protein AAF927_08690 [Bacteroidota bacterium]